ncbi:(5-formylfuran-3-yl)methyl phosphate synthase [Methylobacterium sp. ID0610]|uniref:(5-formylfuran-3-yl)methyl phosphate synthase n=1 Tax=Methylobacterium carpenticola TaxID=3344827 RepID=UPI003695B22D
MPFSAAPDQPRVRLLVSVRDAAEAALARAEGADLVDAKDPDRGALGGLPVEAVRAIAAAAAGGLTSAVAGEPGDAAEAAAMLGALAGTGVDFLKIALPAGPPPADLALPPGPPVIAVLFAEDRPDPAILPALAAAGFRGAMIDTRGKDGRRLTDHLALDHLAAFTAACRRFGLLSGLAGSLRLDDVPVLAPLAPGYLGFRGGLCAGHDRRTALDARRIAEAARRLATAAARPAAA